MKAIRIGLGVLALSALVAGSASATTIGSPLINRPIADYNTGGLFIYNLAFPTVGETVTSWSFFSNGAVEDPLRSAAQNVTTGRLVTPMLFQFVSGTDYKIVGIGTTQTNLGSGIQSFAFGLASGSALIGANTYFGWRDGTADGTTINDGSIELDLTGGPGLYYYPDPAPTTFSAPVTVGNQFTFISNAGTTERTYSVQATSELVGPNQNAAAVPEPATLSLLGLGLAGLAATVRRRRQ